MGKAVGTTAEYIPRCGLNWTCGPAFVLPCFTVQSVNWNPAPLQLVLLRCLICIPHWPYSLATWIQKQLCWEWMKLISKLRVTGCWTVGTSHLCGSSFHYSGSILRIWSVHLYQNARFTFNSLGGECQACTELPSRTAVSTWCPGITNPPFWETANHAPNNREARFQG